MFRNLELAHPFPFSPYSYALDFNNSFDTLSRHLLMGGRILYIQVQYICTYTNKKEKGASSRAVRARKEGGCGFCRKNQKPFPNSIVTRNFFYIYLNLCKKDKPPHPGWCNLGLIARRGMGSPLLYCIIHTQNKKIKIKIITRIVYCLCIPSFFLIKNLALLSVGERKKERKKKNMFTERSKGRGK